MLIQSKRVGNKYLLELEGRLDASWSEYVGSAIETAIQAGEHQIEIDLSKVLYISSAGVSVLLSYRKRLASVSGTLRVSNPNENVRSVLQLMRVDRLLFEGSNSTSPPGHHNHNTEFEKNGARFEAYPLSATEPISCEWFGNPQLFSTGQIEATNARTVRLEGKRFCLGLGAFENVQANTLDKKERGRFGESLAVAGIAVEQATDGSRLPDFQVAQGDMVPELELIYGAIGQGDYSCLMRVEAGRSERGTLRFSDFIHLLFERFDWQAAAITMIVEAASVVGASLIQSPTDASGVDPWSFPQIRDWLSFTTEQSEDRKIAVIVGIASKAPKESDKPFLRPLCEGSSVQGHFHAALFLYRPLAKGMLHLKETVHDLFATDSPRSVLHLLSDDRPLEGVGQTEIMRGACWLGPITNT
ncbi:MAG: hypothetical protein RLY14_979 [Planctomycetota bacterium]|jgi:anti-anti-sigma factor